MNLTRRNILKALGIGAAVSVSGASIAKDQKSIRWDEMLAAVKIMDAHGLNITSMNTLDRDKIHTDEALIFNTDIGKRQVFMAHTGRWEVI